MLTEKTAEQNKYDRELKLRNVFHQVQSCLVLAIGVSYFIGIIGFCVTNSGKSESVDLRFSETPAQCVERYVKKRVTYPSKKFTQNCFEND